MIMVTNSDCAQEEFGRAWARLTNLSRHHSSLEPLLVTYSFTDEGLSNLAGGLAEASALIAAPILTSWSRLPHLNRVGPRPLRSAVFPWGLPDLSEAQAARINSENARLHLLINIIDAFLKGTGRREHPRFFLLLQPEDLGEGGGGHPASIWQLGEVKELAMKHQLQRGAVQQCRLGECRQSMPTGVLTNGLPHPSSWKIGWPKLHRISRKYLGPLPQPCGCGQRHFSLIRRGRSFASRPDAVQPSTFAWIADILHRHSSPRITASEVGPPLERGFDLADLLPRWVKYGVVSEEYDTDGTILMDPTFDSPSDAIGEPGQVDYSDATVQEHHFNDITDATVQGHQFNLSPHVQEHHFNDITDATVQEHQRYLSPRAHNEEAPGEGGTEEVLWVPT